MPALDRTTAYQWYLGSEFWAAKAPCAQERAGYIRQRCFKNRSIENYSSSVPRRSQRT
jgi:hypothetical protein